MGPRRARPPPASGTYLGDFSPDEYVMARWRYGLAGSEFRSDLARHPFFLRMWSEIRDQQLHQGLGVNPTAYELLELYAEAVARNVSRATGRSGVPSHTPPQIGRLLHDLGADALANQANLLTASQVEARLVGKPGMLAILVGEHVIEEGRESYRFAFDSIAEYLMSHHIDPTAFTEAQVRTLARYGSDSQAGALGLALLRAEHAGRHAVVAAALDGVMRTRHSIRCLALLLADFRDAPSHLERLRRAAQQGSEFGSWYSEIVVAVSRLLHSGRIPVAQVVDLFRPAFVHDDPYRFEWGHWQGRWSTPEFEADCGMGGRATLSKAILDAFDTYPQETMGVLLEWLGDRTAFAERGSVHIEDVAAAFLYHRRLLVFDELCDALAGHRAGVASLLLSRVIGAEPTRALTILDRWSQEGSASRDLWVARLAGQFTSADPKAGGERLAVILDRIWDRLGGADAVRHNDLFLTLVTALSRCESRRDRVFDLIREWCLQSASGFVTLLAHPHRKWSSYAALA